MAGIYILDTSAIISGKNLPYDVEYYIPESVLNEIKFRDNLSFFLENLKVHNPGKESIEKAIEFASKTGDIHKLSKTDLDIIALAIEINGIVITDDYAIQNVLKYIGLNYSGLSQREISKIFQWKYRCTGCMRYYEKYYESCPVCGSKLKLVKKHL